VRALCPCQSHDRPSVLSMIQLFLRRTLYKPNHITQDHSEPCVEYSNSLATLCLSYPLVSFPPYALIIAVACPLKLPFNFPRSGCSHSLHMRKVPTRSRSIHVATLHARDCVGLRTAYRHQPMVQEGLATFGRPSIDAKCSDVRFVP